MMDFRNTPEYCGDSEIGLNAWLIGFSTVIYGLRLFVRISITKSPGLDDVMAGIAYLILVVISAIDIKAVSFGSGAHVAFVPHDLLSKFYKSLVIQTLLYFWAVAMVRFAILAFLPRLAQDRSIRIASWLGVAIIMFQTVTAFTLRLVECTPIADSFKLPSDPGLHCVDISAHDKMMAVHGILGIVVDVILLILPIWVICTKMMWSKKTLQIILILSVGIFAVATGIVRVALMRTRDMTADMTWEMPSLGIWTNLEGHVGLWCSCFPALQPILRMVPGKLKLLSITHSNGTQRNNIPIPSHSGISKVHSRRKESFVGADTESQRGFALLEASKSETTLQDSHTSV